MKFLALISGGKDSFYNIHHCLTLGHELVALGNLFPKEVDELDSFMFQTVGHDIIEYYSQCLEVPLYRQPIEGDSKNQNLDYTYTEDDEIEDLFKLIQMVLLKHPDIKGVSCGAILSFYQRTRIENICERLGLTSLTFLWQIDQLLLLKEMCDSGLDARIIKVAAIGLTEKHLGKSITELCPMLIKLNEMYDVHICGEGGEFETIVLDCKLFKSKKLKIIEAKIVNHSAGVAYLKFGVELVDKLSSGFECVSIPPLLDETFENINQRHNSDHISKVSDHISNMSYTVESIISKVDNNLIISNLTDTATDIKQQLSSIFIKLDNILTQYNLGFNNIQHVTLLLSDMGEFNDINEIYESQFSNSYLPPSRVCIETNISSLVQLSCKCIIKDNIDKKGIHVRSRSYWAPQNIGPYSQARIEHKEQFSLATISGQIPLIPSTMELCRDVDQMAILSLQHLHRIKTLTSIGEISYIVCFVTNRTDLVQVKQIWDNYCHTIETKDICNRLVISEVRTLPKNAIIEWAAETFRKNEYFYEEDNDVDTRKIDPVFVAVNELFPSASITDLGSLKLFIIFTNSWQKINNLFEVMNNSVYSIKILCNNEDFRAINNGFEFLPVIHNYDHQLVEYKYNIILTVEKI